MAHILTDSLCGKMREYEMSATVRTMTAIATASNLRPMLFNLGSASCMEYAPIRRAQAERPPRAQTTTGLVLARSVFINICLNAMGWTARRRKQKGGRRVIAPTITVHGPLHSWSHARSELLEALLLRIAHGTVVRDRAFHGEAADWAYEDVSDRDILPSVHRV